MIAGRQRIGETRRRNNWAIPEFLNFDRLQVLDAFLPDKEAWALAVV